MLRLTCNEDFLASESYEYLSNSLFRRAVLFDAVRIIKKRYSISMNVTILLHLISSIASKN